MAREIRIVHQGFAPRTDADGRSRLPTPYTPMIDPCRVCPGRCCHAQVTVPIPDAVTIAAILGLPILHVVAPTPTPHPRAFAIDDDPRITVRMTPFAGRVELTLRRQESGRCAFLADVGGFLRCSIYSVRPGACRTYPAAWTTDEERGSPGTLLCPIPYAITPEVEAQLTRDVGDWLDGWALHDVIAARWAAAEVPDRSLDRFLAFAMAETRAERGVDVGRIPARSDATEALVQAFSAAQAPARAPR